MKTILSLCDRTGNMVRPWAEAGYPCIIVDIQHPPGESEFAENVTAVGADIREYLPPIKEYMACFSSPPCTHLAVSGARWFKEKGLAGLIEGLQLVEACRRICEWTGAPWMLENPVSTLSSYWRKPDFSFHPWEYAGYLESTNDRYTKKTCLWTGCGFRMPPLLPDPPATAKEAEKIWRMAPSDDRADMRSETPMGFAYAVYQEMSDENMGVHHRGLRPPLRQCADAPALE